MSLFFNKTLGRNIKGARYLVAAGFLFSANCVASPNEQLLAALSDEVQLEKLLVSGIDPDTRENHSGRTALAAAVETKLPGTVKILLRHGADPLASGSLFGSPLALALCEGEREMAKAMIRGTKSMSTKAAGELADSAFRCEKENMIDLLPNGARHHANAVLSAACHGPKYINRAHEAIQNGADVNRSDASGNAPFFYGLCYRNEALLRLATSKKLDFQKKNNKGKTIFHTVAETGDLADVATLIRVGAPVPENAIVLRTSERIVENNRTETVYVPGNRTAKRTTKGEKTIQDTSEIPLLEFAKANDPELYRLLLSKLKKQKTQQAK